MGVARSILDRVAASGDASTAGSDDLVARIEEIGRLPNGWDGASAVRPSLATLERATRFAQALTPELRAGTVVAAADGSIEFEWEAGDNGQAVAVAVVPDGLFLLAAFNAEGVIAEEESDEPAQAAGFVDSFLGGSSR